MIARPSAFLPREVADAVGGALLQEGSRPLLGVATDTKDALTDHLFVALVGARFDAHDFLQEALHAGASGLLVSDAGYSRVGVGDVDTTLVVVPDTLRALGDLARYHKRNLAVPALALTGSNGKTTTKEMVAAIQAQARPCLKTQGNLNNLIGVPLTLLGLEVHHRVAVVEMGMNRPGEIARYTELAEPVAGMVLNVGPAHIGELGSMEAVAHAKGELFKGLPAGAVAVVNLDDPRVVGQASAAAALQRTFGRDPSADVHLTSAAPRAQGGQDLVLHVDGRRMQAFLPLDGAHNALNAVGAVALATARPDLVPVELDAVAEGLAKVVVPGGRLAARAVGDLWVIDDGYNANRASMEAALATAAGIARARGGRLVALLGEMRELGEFSEAEHARVGEAAAAAGAVAVAAFGPGAGPIARAAQGAGAPAHHEAEDDAALFAWARERWRPGDVVLVKGSRGIRMERFIRLIEGEVD